MHLDWWTVAMPIGLTVLGLLLTGPGMWSDRWGWGVLGRRAAPKPPRPEQGP